MSASLSALDSAVTLLRQHPDVVAASALATGDTTVVAVVPGPLASLVDLRDHLWESLPAAELPDLLLPVAAIPTSVTETVGGLTFRPVSTPTEIAVAQVWGEVLGRARVGADDNFLDLGGDSMTAALLLDLTNERFGVGLTLGDLLAAPSLAAVAATIDAAATDAAASAATTP